MRVVLKPNWSFSFSAILEHVSREPYSASPPTRTTWGGGGAAGSCAASPA
ncbi:MAG: hypothetical protein O7J95_03915 [Planctomycetota bacterium]|nr:hypothetical protein [Planctomycetota bacterium]